MSYCSFTSSRVAQRDYEGLVNRPTFLSSSSHCFLALLVLGHSVPSDQSFVARVPVPCNKGLLPVDYAMDCTWTLHGAPLCFNLPTSHVKCGFLFVCFFCFYLITESHYMAKGSFEFSVCSRLALSSW